MFPNGVHDSKMKPRLMPMGSLKVPKVAANAESNYEENEDIDPMDEESAAFDE